MMDTLIKKLHKPCDPSLLTFFRVSFGLLMMIDIPQERGMAHADAIYDGSIQAVCRFPLIHGMKPFSQDIMVLLYAVLFANAFSIAVGFLYRLNIFCFACIYWYIFILDVSVWNNHSYLYGLIAVLLLVTNANNYLSVDGIINKKNNNTDVPQWNYLLLRFQQTILLPSINNITFISGFHSQPDTIFHCKTFGLNVFLVYFYAGLKKTEADWLTGYSMHKLSQQWIFDPMRIFMTNENIDLWLVHIGGFVFDSTVGFLLLFDRTRILGLVFCGIFHGMNSRMFSIGMFPYVMFASSFIFCHPRSFKDFLHKLPLLKEKIDTGKANMDPACIYPTHERAIQKRSWKQFAAVFFAILYISEQTFLPYSHFILKGYNGWTPGLYGYSWDMMVHSFKNQHVKITYKNWETGEIGFLKPNAFLKGKRTRWTTQPVMAVQYARCIKEQLTTFGIKNSSVYFDVWKSLNGRFQQRIFEPQVDLASYPWHLFQNPSFVLPLLSHLSEWREKLRDIKKSLKNITTDYDVVFMADFPGMHMDNYVQQDLNTSVEVLNGEIVIETTDKRNISLVRSDKYQIQPGGFHTVYTVSPIPSCYAYIYINETTKKLRTKIKAYENLLGNDRNDQIASEGDSFDPTDPEIAELYWREQRYKQSKKKRTLADIFQRFLFKKVALCRRSFLLVYYSTRNLLFGKPDSEDKYLSEIDNLNLWNFPDKSKTSSDSMTNTVTSETSGIKTEL